MFLYQTLFTFKDILKYLDHLNISTHFSCNISSFALNLFNLQRHETRPLQSCIVRNLYYTDSCLFKNEETNKKLLLLNSLVVSLSFKTSHVGVSQYKVTKFIPETLVQSWILLNWLCFVGREHFDGNLPIFHFKFLSFLLIDWS